MVRACCCYVFWQSWQSRMRLYVLLATGRLSLQVMEDSRTACFGCNALQLTLCAQPCAITERVRSRGCSQIDRWLHHPLLHDQIVLVTSPMI